MSKRASAKVEKVSGTNPYLTTKIAWRLTSGTSTYPQTIKFKRQYKYLKGFVFDCYGGSNADEQLNVDERSYGVYRPQFQIQSKHTEVP